MLIFAMGSFYINTDRLEDPCPINLAEACNFDDIDPALTPTTATLKDFERPPLLHSRPRDERASCAESDTLRPLESFSYVYADIPFMKPNNVFGPALAPSKQQQPAADTSTETRCRPIKRPRRGQESVADLHCLYPSADFEIYCPWFIGDGGGARCGQLVLLDNFTGHLKTHLERIAIGRERGPQQDAVACKVPLANGLPCATVVVDANGLKKHILSQDHVLIEGHQRQRDGTWGATVVLKKMTCRYCRREYSMYVGGNPESLRRHVQAKHPERCIQPDTGRMQFT